MYVRLSCRTLRPASGRKAGRCNSRPAGKPDVRRTPMFTGSPQRIVSVARKELLHIVRDPQTLFFTLFMPVLELIVFGFAINTNVRDVRTVILDQAGTQESRALLQRFENSEDFKIVARVY